MQVRSLFLIGLVCCGWLLPGHAGTAKAQSLPGPLNAELLRVIDGDSLAVRVTIWLDQTLEVVVRLRGIDAPERRGRCADERRRALEARDALARLVAGRRLALSNIEDGKFAGRVIADVTAGEVSLSDALLAGGFARPYAGGTRRGWCGGQSTIR